jgi:hypothetical protein
MRQERRSDGAYTSVSVALSHTVDIVPAQSPAATPTSGWRAHRDSSAAVSPPAAAVHAAERRLTAATGDRTEASARDQRFATRTYSGVPGGCGMPRVCAAAANSPASQKVTSGAAVSA